MGTSELSDALQRAVLSPHGVRAAGAGDALTARLIERAGFDAVWASGLSISAANAVPDASILTMTELLSAASSMVRATTLPVIADCDTGFGDVNNVRHMVRAYEQAGIAAVCIEDKEYPKRNSFQTGGHALADPTEFAAKIEAAKAAQRTDSFMVLSRIESLIAGWPVEVALERAHIYAAAGADVILIHSRASTADEVAEFARQWHAEGGLTPLAAVPTTYCSTPYTTLRAAGFQIVIYANQPLRAAVSAMRTVLETVLSSDSTEVLEPMLAPIDDVLELIGTDELEAWERRFACDRDGAGSALSPHPLHR